MFDHLLFSTRSIYNIFQQYGSQPVWQVFPGVYKLNFSVFYDSYMRCPQEQVLSIMFSREIKNNGKITPLKAGQVIKPIRR